MNKRKKNLAKRKYLHLSKLGTDHNLSFSSSVAIGEKMIGLDGIKKKILVCDYANDQSFIIELDKVKAVSLKKEYSDIKPGELDTRTIEEFLKSIQLRFEYSDKMEVVTFYHRERDGINLWLQKMSRNWQIMLSKIVGSRKETRAGDGNVHPTE